MHKVVSLRLQGVDGKDGDSGPAGEKGEKVSRIICITLDTWFYGLSHQP